jgi:hypothetical protein
MSAFYFSCGQIHRHKLPSGRIWDKNSLLKVEAETLERAEDIAVHNFGAAWSMCYWLLPEDWRDYWKEIIENEQLILPE